ncbi:MAG: DUF6503 family protein [Bacteroidota bacterium]
MKPLLLILSLLWAISCAGPGMLTSEQVLEASRSFHDPNQAWESATLSLRIQEPRIQNPTRYSNLLLNNADGSFSLERNRDEHISTHIVNSNGEGSVLFNGSADIDSQYVAAYRLSPERSLGYRGFYEFMYGLPMSITEERTKSISPLNAAFFNDKACYQIEVELVEPLISAHWYLYFRESDFRMEGVEIFFPDEPEKGEKIIFDHLAEINGMKIPRIRNWYELSNGDYSGSDIIVSEIEVQ